MEQARTLEPVVADESPLAHARLHLQLTVDEAARRANISPEEVQWLEEGRLYRFPTPDHALLSTVLYATGLGLEHRDALELAGLPAPPSRRSAASSSPPHSPSCSPGAAPSRRLRPPRRLPRRCRRRGRSRSSC